MRDLHIWPTNPFDDAAISISNLVTFATDNLTRMTANNSGSLFTARITATTTALASVNTAFQSDQGNLGDRKAANKAKADFRKALTAGSAKIQIALQQKYGKKASQLDIFFPNGLTAFNATRDELMEDALQTLVTKLTQHQTDVGAQTVTDATALLTGWQSVHSPSETSAGAKTSSMQAKNTARAALQLELFKNLLLIATTYPRQPEQVDVYMQQSLLQPHNPSSPSQPTPPPTPPPGP